MPTVKRKIHPKPNPLLILLGVIEVEPLPRISKPGSIGKHLLANLTHGGVVYTLHATKGYRRRK